MKSTNLTLAIIPLVVGLGMAASVAAQSQDLLQTLDKTLTVQGQQVTQSITNQLQKSYQNDIAIMARKAAIQWNDKEQVIANNHLNVVKNTKNSGK